MRTLGGLSLEGSDFRRSKPLQLLTYLALEGPQERRYVAELFWMGSARPLSGLSVALTMIRNAAPEAVGADDKRVWTDLPCDAQLFLDALDEGDWSAALSHYGGPFLAGTDPRNASTELEEWLYATREHLGKRSRQTLLVRARDLARDGDLAEAAAHAERAYRLQGAPELDPDEMEELYTVLVAGASPLAAALKREAEEFGLALDASPEQARESLEPPPQDFGGSARSTLPTPATPLVGRDPERLEIARMLDQDDCRLVTLTGLGGVGKTRLSIQVALDLEPAASYEDGIFAVFLDAVRSPEQIARSLAEPLGLLLRSEEDLMRQVAEAIADRRILMVLDNFEHLVEAAAELSDLLAACPNLNLLVSSRERLNIAEEWAFPIEGLTYPSRDPDNVGEVRYYDAVQLFLQRARRVNPRFEATDEDLTAIVRICRLVDGSPLGLELAATWVRLLVPGEIAAEIQGNLDFLSTSMRDAPERHHSLRAVFEQSWGLLTQKEQAVLRTLSVFRGGFRRESASRVTAATLPILASLVDKSLLRVSSSGRYDRHVLLYGFMEEKLAAHPDELAEARSRHGHTFGHFVQDRYQDFLAGNQGTALDAIEQDLENIRLAWTWAVANREATLLLAMCDPIRQFHDTRARYGEGRALFAAAAAAFDDSEPLLLGYVLVLEAWLASWLGNYDDALVLSERGMALLRPLGKDDHLAQGLNILGTIGLRSGNYHRARRHFQETLELVNGRKRINALNNLAMALDALGDYGAAIEHYEEALEWNRKANNAAQVVINIINLSNPLSGLCAFERSKALLLEGVELARQHDLQQTLPYLLSNLGSVLERLGDLREAQARCEEALTLGRRSSDPVTTMFTLSVLGRIAIGLADTSRASAYLTEALEIAARQQPSDMTFKPIEEAANLLASTGEPEAAAAFFHLIHRHPVSDQLSRDISRERLEELAPHLSADAADRAEGRGAELAELPLAESIASLTRSIEICS